MVVSLAPFKTTAAEGSRGEFAYVLQLLSGQAPSRMISRICFCVLLSSRLSCDSLTPEVVGSWTLIRMGRLTLRRPGFKPENDDEDVVEEMEGVAAAAAADAAAAFCRWFTRYSFLTKLCSRAFLDEEALDGSGEAPAMLAAGAASRVSSD